MLRRVGKLFLLALALVAGGLLALHTTARETVAGSGKSATQQRNLGDATEVVLCGTGDLILEAGDTPMLSVTADDNVLPVIVTKVDGKKLILRPRSHTTVHPQTPITYTLTLPRLKSITHSGTGTISAERLDADNLMVKLSGASNANLMNLTCKSLTLNLSGAGRARLTGVTDTLKLNQSGTTGIDARGLKATNAEVRVSGTSNATVWAEHELKARTSGKGEIQYKGRPSQISQRSSCSSRIHPIE